jgi:hypothetical protein
MKEKQSIVIYLNSVLLKEVNEKAKGIIPAIRFNEKAVETNIISVFKIGKLASFIAL